MNMIFYTRYWNRNIDKIVDKYINIRQIVHKYIGHKIVHKSIK